MTFSAPTAEGRVAGTGLVEPPARVPRVAAAEAVVRGFLRLVEAGELAQIDLFVSDRLVYDVPGTAQNSGRFAGVRGLRTVVEVMPSSLVSALGSRLIELIVDDEGRNVVTVHEIASTVRGRASLLELLTHFRLDGSLRIESIAEFNTDQYTLDEIFGPPSGRPAPPPDPALVPPTPTGAAIRLVEPSVQSDSTRLAPVARPTRSVASAGVEPDASAASSPTRRAPDRRTRSRRAFLAGAAVVLVGGGGLAARGLLIEGDVKPTNPTPAGGEPTAPASSSPLTPPGSSVPGAATASDSVPVAPSAASSPPAISPAPAEPSAVQSRRRGTDDVEPSVESAGAAESVAAAESSGTSQSAGPAGSAETSTSTTRDASPTPATTFAPPTTRPESSPTNTTMPIRLAVGGTVRMVADAGPIQRGQVVFERDDVPVVALWGAPVSRRLGQGVLGEDVRSLNDNLRALGYDAPSGDRFDDATLRAVRAFQFDFGLVVDGTVDPGDVLVVPEGTRLVGPVVGSGLRALAAGDVVIEVEEPS